MSGFRRDDDEICALLGYYAASCGNCLLTFRDKVSVPSSRVKSPTQIASGAHRAFYSMVTGALSCGIRRLGHINENYTEDAFADFLKLTIRNVRCGVLSTWVTYLPRRKNTNF